MKTIFIFLIAFFIILKSSIEIQECNIRTSLQIIPPKIWYEQAIDGPFQNRLLTRVLHNKAGIFINEVSGCYMNHLSPVFIYQATGLFGLCFWIYFAYRAVVQNQRMIILILLMLPLIPVASANAPTYLFGLGLISNLYKLIAFTGLITFFKIKK